VDCRDPVFFRNGDLERYVKEVGEDKLNFLLLNKADLIEEPIRKVWSSYFNSKGIKHIFFSAKTEQKKIDSEITEEADLNIMDMTNTHQIVKRSTLQSMLHSLVTEYKNKVSEIKEKVQNVASPAETKPAQEMSEKPVPEAIVSKEEVAKPVQKPEEVKQVQEPKSTEAREKVEKEGGKEKLAEENENSEEWSEEEETGKPLKKAKDTKKETKTKKKPVKTPSTNLETPKLEVKKPEENLIAKQVEEIQKLAEVNKPKSTIKILKVIKNEEVAPLPAVNLLQKIEVFEMRSTLANPQISEKTNEDESAEESEDEDHSDCDHDHSGECDDIEEEDEDDSEEQPKKGAKVTFQAGIKENEGATKMAMEEKEGEETPAPVDIYTRLGVDKNNLSSKPFYTKRDENKVVIGMIGFPNVGKSSVINVLCNKRLVGVGARPGKTKNFQTIFLDKDLILCDCPGLIFPSIVHSKPQMVSSAKSRFATTLFRSMI
jgi:ribosome biogenesis GTPase A